MILKLCGSCSCVAINSKCCCSTKICTCYDKNCEIARLQRFYILSEISAILNFLHYCINSHLQISLLSVNHEQPECLEYSVIFIWSTTQFSLFFDNIFTCKMQNQLLWGFLEIDRRKKHWLVWVRNVQKNKNLSLQWTFHTYDTCKLSLIYCCVLPMADLNIVFLSFLPASSQKKHRFLSSLVEDLAAVPREVRLVLIGLGCVEVSSSESSSLTSACFLLWALVSFALLHLLKHDLCHDAWWDRSVSSTPPPSSRRDKGTWIGSWPNSSNFGGYGNKVHESGMTPTIRTWTWKFMNLKSAWKKLSEWV